MKKLMIFTLFLLMVSAISAKQVKFAVDMTGQTINATGVHVAGDFQAAAGFAGGDWQPNTTVLTQEAGTDIYSIVVDIPAFAKYEYKFLNGDLWYDVEFVPVESRVGYNFNDNRWIFIDSTSNDITEIGPIRYSGNAPAGKYLLRFKVDLQDESSVSTSGVHVAGDFQGWDTRGNILYSFVDKVYENIVYIDQLAGTVSYRYCNGAQASGYETVPAECSVDGSRQMVMKKDTAPDVVCFNACVACNVQGIAPSDQNVTLNIYPNPVKDILQIGFNREVKDVEIGIYNLTGQCVKSLSFNSFTNQNIDATDLKSGLYFVRINGKGIETTRRLIVE
jgi:hypothetical protein